MDISIPGVVVPKDKHNVNTLDELLAYAEDRSTKFLANNSDHPPMLVVKSPKDDSLIIFDLSPVMGQGPAYIAAAGQMIVDETKTRLCCIVYQMWVLAIPVNSPEYQKYLKNEISVMDSDKKKRILQFFVQRPGATRILMRDLAEEEGKLKFVGERTYLENPQTQSMLDFFKDAHVN